MRKITALLVGTAIIAGAAASYAGMGAATGVNGSLHDMNFYANQKNGTKETYERVCVYCHTPHNAIVKDPNDPLGVNFLPLWNHAMTPLTYTAYNWATPDNTPFTIGDPLIGPSRLCMSCHDGATAVDQHGPASPMAGSIKLSGNRAVGRDGDLTDDHPIGFDYVNAKTKRNNITVNGSAVAISEIVDEGQAFATNITNSADGVQGSANYNTVQRNGTRLIKSTLYNGSIMTCASCHEVHNKENATQVAGTNGITPNYFLYAKEQNSLICLSCHIK